VFQNLHSGTSSQNTIHSTQIYFHGLCASCSMRAGTA
jgi:Fe-S cluster biogenesis protein NfuA